MTYRPSRSYADIIKVILRGNWPLAVCLALLTVVIGWWVVPVWLGHGVMFAQGATALKPLVWGLFGLFTLVAIMKYRFARRTDLKRAQQQGLSVQDASAAAGESLNSRSGDPASHDLDKLATYRSPDV